MQRCLSGWVQANYLGGLSEGCNTVTLNDRTGGEGRRDSKSNFLDTLRSLGSGQRPAIVSSERPWFKSYPHGMPSQLAYPHQPLGWLLQQAAERYPTRLACHYYHEQLTYEEMLQQAQSLAATLVHEGLQPGDRVGVLLPNLPDSLITHFATWFAGGVVVSLSPLMVQEEVGALIRTANCRMVVTLDVLSPLVCSGEHQPEVVILSSMQGRLSRIEQLGYAWVRFQRIGFSSICPRTRVINFTDAVKKFRDPVVTPAIKPDDLAFVLPTGGTTGAPKAVALSHRNLIAQAWQLSHWSRGMHGEEAILAVLPFFHSYGLSSSVMMGMAMGATLIIHHRFRPMSTVQLIERRRPTMFMAVPAMLAALNSKVLRARKYDLSSIRAVISGGAPLPATVVEEFRQHTGAIVVEGYGLSEASPVTHVGPVDGTAIAGTIGLPLPDTDARIVDSASGTKTLSTGEIGELVVRGPQVMLGYWNDTEATARVIRDGWLHTGDLACCDEKGFFRIVDRIKDLIITSGFNVYPGDVEEVLRGYPGVKDVAVVGMPDTERGEIVKAIVVVESPKAFRLREFQHFAHEKLAAFKRPRIVEVQSEDLPRNFLGKVLRRRLRGTAVSPDSTKGDGK